MPFSTSHPISSIGSRSTKKPRKPSAPASRHAMWVYAWPNLRAITGSTNSAAIAATPFCTV